MNDDFRETLSRLALSLYQFSHLLIPDRLQAQQVVIDSLAQLAVSWPPMAEGLRGVDMQEQRPQLKIHGFKAAYSLARARSHQLGLIEQLGLPGQGVWEGSSLQERAALYLFYRLKFSKRDIAEILNVSIYEAMAMLASARDWLDEKFEDPFEVSGHA